MHLPPFSMIKLKWIAIKAYVPALHMGIWAHTINHHYDLSALLQYSSDYLLITVLNSTSFTLFAVLSQENVLRCNFPA